MLARLHKVNPAINAVVRVLEEEARGAAETADAARARGHALPPLHGVPVTTKVNVDQAGLPTDNGVVPLKDFMAKEDSPVVANLKHAGAIIVGRTNAPAFSMRIFTDNALHGRTLNPRDPSVTPGGSSGGAGAATATGIGAIAHGNDIGGSVRIPAYCNGVVGLRTGFGRIPSLNPSAPAGRPIGAVLMAVQGPHTRTVRDARLALQVMARGDRRDWRWNDVPMAGPAAGAADQGRDRARGAGRPDASRADGRGAAGGQAPAGGGLRRRGGAAARHGAWRRALAHHPDHRRSIVAGGVTSAAGQAASSNCYMSRFFQSGGIGPQIVDAGHNLEDRDQCLFSSSSRDLVNTNPRLAALANNGGDTDTVAPMPGSPAIDHATLSHCSTVDQRHVLRPQGPACDIGAVEVRQQYWHPIRVNVWLIAHYLLGARFNPKVGGDASLILETGGVGVTAAGCSPGQVRAKGQGCRPAQITGHAYKHGKAGIKTTLTASLTSAQQTALKHGKTLRLIAVLTYSSHRHTTYSTSHNFTIQGSSHP